MTKRLEDMTPDELMAHDPEAYADVYCVGCENEREACDHSDENCMPDPAYWSGLARRAVASGEAATAYVRRYGP